MNKFRRKKAATVGLRMAFLYLAPLWVVAAEPETVVMAEVPQLFRFDNLYEVSLGIVIVLLFLSLWWLTLLRRKVREQAVELRAHFEALRQSEERFSSAFRASPVAIAIANATDGRLLDVNGSFVKLFGYPREDAVGKTAMDLSLWSKPEDKTNLEKLVAENGSVGGVEVVFKVRSGEMRTALVFIEKIQTGDSSSLLWITHDMTDRLNLESQVRHLLKMEAVGRLAAGVAHDFNNLLTVVQGNTEWVMKKFGNDEDVSTPLRRIQEATHRAANLTRQLLTFSRKEKIALCPLDLNMAVTTATKMFKHLLRSDIVMRIRFSAALPAAMADVAMLEQALMNLVVNARDAMAHGGELTISSRKAAIDRAYVARHPEATEGEFVCLEVSDTGCGMDAATQARIFEPFFTTKPPGQGTGLGLATVYGIVKQHHGWIEVVSEKNVGTTFKLYIPANRNDYAVAARKPMERPSILLLEDEPAVMETMARSLVDQGHRVFQASSGIEAMQVWSEHPGDIKLLLTDVRMPLGMSGFDVAENLLALNPELKVVFVSGYPGEGSAQESALRRGSVFLTKPCPPEELRMAISNVLGPESV